LQPLQKLVPYQAINYQSIPGCIPAELITQKLPALSLVQKLDDLEINYRFPGKAENEQAADRSCNEY